MRSVCFFAIVGMLVLLAACSDGAAMVEAAPMDETEVEPAPAPVVNAVEPVEAEIKEPLEEASPPAQEALSQDPSGLLLGTWVGERVEHVPRAQQEAALTIGRAMHLTFTRDQMITSLESVGERKAPYRVVARSPRSVTIATDAEAGDEGRRVMLTFRSDGEMLMPLQGRARLVLRRASLHR